MPLILGIIIAFQHPLDIIYTKVWPFLLGFFGIIFMGLMAKTRFKILKWLLNLFLLFSIGFLSYVLTSNKIMPDSNLIIGISQQFLLEIKEITPKPSGDLIKARILRFGGDSLLKPSHETILCVWNTEKLSEEIEVGDKIWVTGKLKEIEGSKIPFGFDRKQFYRTRYIYKEVLLSYDRSPLYIKKEGFHFKNYMHHIRSSLKNLVKDKLDSELASSMLLAMMLGDKSDLTYELKSVFSKTGVIHVLAVSGLHVGIIFLIVQFLLKTLFAGKLSPKLSALLLLSAIWGFAILSGMSPSVSRAAFMFSLISLGKVFSRNAGIYNIIACSAFFILCVDPARLYDLGFQLSYAAVLSIVSIYPILNILCPSSNGILTKLWSMLSVSIAAQIGTLPITLYYFNQFPTYFLLANLIAIPSTSIILMLGIALVISSGMSNLSDWIAYGIKNYIEFVVHVLNEIHHWPFASLTIFVTPYSIPIGFGFIILVLTAFYNGYKKLILVSMILLMIVVSFGFIKNNTSKKGAYISSIRGQLFLGSASEQFHDCVIIEVNPDTNALIRQLNKYWLSNGWQSPKFHSLDSVDAFNPDQWLNLKIGETQVWVFNDVRTDDIQITTSIVPDVIVFNHSTCFSLLNELKIKKATRVFAMNLYETQYKKLEEVCADHQIKCRRFEYYDFIEL